MSMMRVYLDTCILSRLGDDRTQTRVRAEWLAILSVFRRISNGTDLWTVGLVLRAEVLRNPNAKQRQELFELLKQGLFSKEYPMSLAKRRRDLHSLGYGLIDAGHLASAEHFAADVLLTTDYRFIKRAARGVGGPLVRVANPVDWLAEVEHDNR